MNNLAIACAAAAAALSYGTAAFADTPVLTPGQPVLIPGAAGHFDYMTFDKAHDRVYASHPGAKTLAVLDLKTGDASQIDLQAAVNGVAVDSKHDRFFTAGGGGKIFTLNGDTLATQTSYVLPGHADGIFYDSRENLLFVDHDDHPEIWVYDPETNNVVRTVTIAGGPESSAFVPKTGILYQNIAPLNEIQEVNVRTGKSLAEWPTAPATDPHGMVMDRKTNRLYCSGKNHELVVLDAKTGKIVQSVDYPSGTDQLAIDPKLRRIYSPGNGSMSVFQLDSAGNASVIGTITLPDTAHTVCVDPSTDVVWICYTGTTHSYFQPFTPSHD